MSTPREQPTRVQPAAPQAAPPPAAPGALDLRTLVITAVASALAAYICSKVWAPGTLASAAFTPVAVAVFREALRKPTEVVTTALPAALPIARRTAGDPGPYGAPTGPGTPFSDTDPTRVHDAVPGPHDQPTQVSPAVGPQEPGAVGAEPVTVHAVTTDGRGRRRWQIAIVTGLLGFVIAALLITVPEVLAGKDNTTIFSRESRNTPTKTQATPATTTTTETVTPTVTTVAPETVTRTETVPTTTTTATETVTEVAPPTTTTTTRTTPADPAIPDDGAVDPADGTP